jgi:adenylate kinase family enzyme
LTKTLIVLLGKPGSGKGFLCDLLISKGLDAKKIIPGKMYRQWVKERRPRWEYILDCMKDRRLVDDDTTISCVEKMIEDCLKEVDLIFMDGFPRDVTQFEALLGIMSEKKDLEIHFVYIDRSDEFCKKKAEERKQKDLAAGNDPRPDSTPEAVQKGLDQFYKHTLPVINEIQKMDYIIHHIKTDDDLEHVVFGTSNLWTLFQLCRFKKTIPDPINSHEYGSSGCSHE